MYTYFDVFNIFVIQHNFYVSTVQLLVSLLINISSTLLLAHNIYLIT